MTDLSTPDASGTETHDNGAQGLSTEELETLKYAQNLPLGIAGGVIAAVGGALVWALITVLTGYQIGWLAVGVGFGCGFLTRALGKGVTPPFGVIGAICALLGCVAGNLMIVIHLIGEQSGIPATQVLGELGMQGVVDIFTGTFSVMDLLFYGLAVYTGYQYGWRKIE